MPCGLGTGEGGPCAGWQLQLLLGALTQAAHAAPDTGSRGDAVPPRPPLRCSMRPSTPRTTLILAAAVGHRGGPRSAGPARSSRQIPNEGRQQPLSKQPSPGVPGVWATRGLPSQPAHPELPPKTVAAGQTSGAAFPGSRGCPRRLQAAPRLTWSRRGIRALLPAVRLARDGWWRLGGNTKATLCELWAERAAIRHGVTFPRPAEASRGRLTPPQPAGTGSHEARAKNTRPLRKSQRGGCALAPPGQLPKLVAGPRGTDTPVGGWGGGDALAVALHRSR